MKNPTMTPHFAPALRASSLAFALATTLSACGGDGPVSNSPTPTVPPAYPVESIDAISGLRASYDFEGNTEDSSGNGGDTFLVGPATSFTELGQLSYDFFGGIHALSEAVVFDGVTGLVLPRNVIASHSFTVSLWVMPEPERDLGTIFFIESDGNTLKFDGSGLTVSGAMGFGRNGDETFTYTSDNFKLEAGQWQHLAFTVDKGNVDMYINGVRVYESGDILGNGFSFGSGDDAWALRDETFNDVFSGGDNTIAIGVSNSEADPAFAGKIDNVRIFDSALYYANVITLSREVVDEGPAAAFQAEYLNPNITLDWSLERFAPESISIVRSRFVEPGTDGSDADVALPEDGSPLDGSVSSFTDVDLPIGQSYLYSFAFTDAEGHRFETSTGDYLRVPGTEPYAEVYAQLNEDTNNIDLSFYTENINVSSYTVLRDTDDNREGAEEIAADITGNTYIDERNDGDFPHRSGTQYYYWISVADTGGNETVSLTMPKASATAAGEFIPLSTIVIEERTPGFCGVDGFIENNHAGAKGEFNEFANTDNEAGKEVRWKVEVGEAGAYNIIVRYANGASDNRWGIMTANGVEIISALNLPGTGAWSTWATTKHVVELDEGEIELTLTAQTAGGLSNIDSLQIEAVDSDVAPVGVLCEE